MKSNWSKTIMRSGAYAIFAVMVIVSVICIRFEWWQWRSIHWATGASAQTAKEPELEIGGPTIFQRADGVNVTLTSILTQLAEARAMYETWRAAEAEKIFVGAVIYVPNPVEEGQLELPTKKAIPVWLHASRRAFGASEEAPAPDG